MNQTVKLHDAIPKGVEMESVPCPLCKSPVLNDQPIASDFDRINHVPGIFSIVSCQTCGLVRTNPRPSPATIGIYYPSDYGPYVGTLVTANSQHAERGFGSTFIDTAKKLFDPKSNAIPPVPAGKMLEVGSASGSYLYQMASKGWDVEGIEYSADAASNAMRLGYTVHIGAIENISLRDSQFDLITGWMVAEHLHDPVSAFEKLAKWAKPEASLAISVPNIDSIGFRLFRSRWYDLHLPNHLYHYSPASITKILDRAGWEVTRICHHRTIFNAIASAGYWFEDHGWKRVGNALINFPGRGGRLGTLLLFPISYVMALLGQTGRMTVWAKRK